MQKNRQMIKKITTAAMVIAISIVISTICKNYLNLGNGVFRITFENLAIIMAGILYGPLTGAMVGLATDIVSYFMSAQAIPIMPLVTLGAAMVGFVSGFIAKYIIREKGTKQIVFSGVFAHLIGSMIIKTIGLYPIYSALVFVRIPIYIVIASVEIFLLCQLFKRKSFTRVVGYTKEEGKNKK